MNEALGPLLPSDLKRYLGAAVDTVIKSALRDLVSEAAAANPPVHVPPLLGPPLEQQQQQQQPVTLQPSASPDREGGTAARDPAASGGLVAGGSSGAPSTAASSLPLGSREGEGGESRPLLVLADALGARPDGRSTRAIRAISAEVGLLPVVHGSAVFSRGDTQVLCTATLGPLDQAQTLRPAGGGAAAPKQCFLHYDFPPYCTNETGKVRRRLRVCVWGGSFCSAPTSSAARCPSLSPLAWCRSAARTGAWWGTARWPSARSCPSCPLATPSPTPCASPQR